MARDPQYELFEALESHVTRLEAERDRASAHDHAVLDPRLEAALRVLEWLSTTLEVGSPSNSNATALKRCSRTGSHSNRIASDPSHAFDILLSNISM
jgi:hypothetical protein